MVDASPEPVCAYVYDLVHLRRHVCAVRAALPDACRLFYAVKANADPSVLGTLAGVVDGFEVASLGELDKVRAVNAEVPVVFGGPGKTDDELDGALARGVALVHVESLHELRRLERLAARRSTVADVLLRVNLAGPLPVATLAMGGVPTQFGIDERELPVVAGVAARSCSVRLRGFHFHSLSNQLDPTAHARLVGLFLRRARRWGDEHGVAVGVVNAGGGFGVDYGDPRRSFDVAGFAPHLSRELALHRPPGTEVVFECGRHLAASCGAYVVEVLDLKVNHGRHFAVVRGGTHHFRLPASWGHSHPFVVVPTDRGTDGLPRPEVRNVRVTVAGQLCSPKDVLARDAPVERLRVGDLVVFHHAGAYGWEISHHEFLSHPPPRFVFLGP